MTSHPHVLPLPKAVFALRIVQLVISVVILGLCAYIVTFIAFNSACLTLFTAIATLIITVYNIVASTGLQAAYNYWAFLALDIFGVIFWLTSMSYLAWTTALTSLWFTTSYTYTSCSYYYYSYCDKKRDLAPREVTDVYTYRNSMAAAAGLGGLEFVLFIVTLVITAIHVHRHRKAGGHSGAAHTGATAPTGPVGGPAPVYQENKNAELQGQQQQQSYAPTPQPQQQQQYAAPQQQPQQFVQQPVPQQPQQQYYAAQPGQQVQGA